MSKKLQSLYGLKWDPFGSDTPIEACRKTPTLEHFTWRVENLSREGGYALVTGEPGTGKTVALRLLCARLAHLRDVTVGIFTRPQCSIPDFYRELGELFGLTLSPHNRWTCTKTLRERWRTHVESALHRAVLIIDEAQQIKPAVLEELRLACATDLDSRTLLTVVLAGDRRLADKFRGEELMALGTRIRVRLALEALKPEELAEFLRHAVAEAGNAQLLTPELVRTLAEHAAGNLRVMMGLASELLDAAVARDAQRLDEKLYLEVFAVPPGGGSSRKSQARGGVR
jgi:type II secretory pathway predicted ATPase ExeA